MSTSAHAVAAAAAVAGARAETVEPGKSRPNIIHIVTHDIGTDLGCYGHPDVKTPNLDRLAAEGVRFTNCFCASTACSPSRGTTMTGRYAHSNGLMGLAHLGWSLPEGEKTITDYLNDVGYVTVHAGFQHERHDRSRNSYQVLLGEDWTKRFEDSYIDVAVDRVVEYLEGHSGGPFYVNLGSFECHQPWGKRSEYDAFNTYDPESTVVPPHVNDAGGIRRTLCSYYATISFMDAQVGRLLSALRILDLEDNTVVLFTTDHGCSFPRAKGTLYDAGVRICLILRWPGTIPSGATLSELIHTVDVLPTLLAMIGERKPPIVQGRSFWPLLQGKAFEPYEQVFMERNGHDFLDFVRAVRTMRYKYIRNYTQRNREMMPSDDPDECNWHRLRDSGIPRPYEELYDLDEDPNEFRNVADAPKYDEVLADMRQRLERWMDETDDPLRGARSFIHNPKDDILYRNLAEDTDAESTG